MVVDDDKLVTIMVDNLSELSRIVVCFSAGKAAWTLRTSPIETCSETNLKYRFATLRDCRVEALHASTIKLQTPTPSPI